MAVGICFSVDILEPRAIYTFLEVGGISFYLETDKSITIMTKRNGYDEL